VGSGQPTEKKTDLREFEEKNSSRRISEGSGATTPEQQQGSLARKNLIFEGYFTDEEKKILREKINNNQFDDDNFQYRTINSIHKNLINDQNTPNIKVRKRIKLMGRTTNKNG
jgi:hypothetical protein